MLLQDIVGWVVWQIVQNSSLKDSFEEYDYII